MKLWMFPLLASGLWLIFSAGLCGKEGEKMPPEIIEEHEEAGDFFGEAVKSENKEQLQKLRKSVL